MKRVHIHLIGFMGTGKSEVGRALAKRLNIPFFDADRAIEKKAKKTIAHIFASHGEARFRALEREVASKLASSVSRVIAWGGGAWLSAENRKNLLGSGTVILLTCSEGELWKRLEPEIPIRPLLSGPSPRAKFKKLLAKRKSAYKGADLTVPTTHKTPAEIARAIHERLKKG
ncbi:MAG: shikimate kinase [Elusimicrobia bacterium]|nr:shikimate kinase [Elusimicrobiota bacterium]